MCDKMAEFYKSRVGENNQLEIHYFVSRVSFSIHNIPNESLFYKLSFHVIISLYILWHASGTGGSICYIACILSIFISFKLNKILFMT